MRRSRWIDWLLLGTLLPVFVAMLVGGIHGNRAAGNRQLPFALSGAQGVDGYPIVRWLRVALSDIHRSDRILRIGDVDLRGLGVFEIEYRIRALLAQGQPIAVEAEREGFRFKTEIEPVPNPSWWWQLPSWCAFVLAATVLGVTLLGGLLAVVPPIAGVASTTLGIDPETGRRALSMALAGIVVPAYRRLRPWLDGWMFAEQHALAERFETLRVEIGASRGVEEMATRAGEGFEQLMKPESVAIYGRRSRPRAASSTRCRRI